MRLDASLAKQGGRRYPQQNGLGGLLTMPLRVDGTSQSATFLPFWAANSTAITGPIAPQPVIR